MRLKADDGSDFPEWEKETLGDVATIVMGQSPDSKNYHEEPVGKVLVQGNADLKDGKVFPRIWTTESPKSAEPGALLMTVRAPVGALAITDIPVALGRGVCAIEGPSILYYLLSKVETEHYWDKVSAGSTFSAVDSSSVNSLKITLPTPAEQERILSLLSTVDSTVALCRRKLYLLTQAKKALMQQIFSRKLRFKADDGSDFPDWEEKKLGDIATIVMGQSPDSKNYSEDPIGKVLVQGNADLKNGKVAPRIWTTESPKSAEPGALLMTVRAPVGALAITDIPVALGRGVCAITGPEILYYQLAQVENNHYWDRVSAGSTFTAIDSSSIKALKLCCPSESEQKKIASCLSSADALVAQARVELKQWQDVKKSLLRQLFV